MPEEKSQLDTGAADNLRIKALELELENQGKANKWIRWLMSSIVVVVFIAFIGMLFTVYAIIQQYLATQTATYQSLIDKVDAQNEKINSIYERQVNESSQSANQPVQIIVPQPPSPQPAE